MKHPIIRSSIPGVPDHWFCWTDDVHLFATLRKRFKPSLYTALTQAAHDVGLDLDQPVKGGYCLGLHLLCRLHNLWLDYDHVLERCGFPLTRLRRARDRYPWELTSVDRKRVATTLERCTRRTEHHFGLALWYHELTFVPEYTVPGTAYKVDFAWPRYRLLVEFDEVYHNTPQQQQRDRARSRVLRQAMPGVRILRVQPHQQKVAIRVIREHIATVVKALYAV